MNDIAIDLGTSTVQVYVKGKGVVLQEPSVVAVDKTSGKVLKIGREAELMLGRTPGNIAAVRPLSGGVISDYDATLKLLQGLIRRAVSQTFFKPRIIVCVPSSITEVEERAICDATIRAGAKKTYLIEGTVAAAIGAGIDISKPVGNLVVDIGGGTTDVAVISMHNVVTGESIKIAGDALNEAIIKYIRRKYNMLIGERTAEEVKIRIGTAWPCEVVSTMQVKGRCLIEGLPKMIELSTTELLEAIEEPVTSIVNAICAVIERTPPELVGDIAAAGIVMTGGSARLNGLDKLIEHVTGIRTFIADNPDKCVAIGAGRSLDNLSLRSAGTINLARKQQERL